MGISRARVLGKVGSMKHTSGKMEACIKAERGRWRGEEMPWTREKTEELLAKLEVGE